MLRDANQRTGTSRTTLTARLSAIAGVLAVMVVSGAPAEAAAGNPIGATPQSPSYYGVTDPVTWDDESVYIVGVGTPNVASEGGTLLNASGWSGRFPTDADGRVPSSAVSMQQGWTNASTGARVSGDSQITTLAIDGGKYTGQSRAYYWSWAETNGSTKVTVPPVPSGSATGSSWKVVRAFDAGATEGTEFVVPGPYLAASNPAFPKDATIPNAYDYWSGGEVVQRTGEIFFGGGECAGIGDDYRMMIFDPSDGSYRASGKLQPATASDAIFGTANNCGGGNGYVGSDFALDSAGNAYLMVLGYAPTTGAGSQWAPLATSGAPTRQLRAYVVRVVPTTSNAGWTYNVVTMVTSDPAETSSDVRGFAGRFGDGTGTPTAATMANLYGAAFLNGTLYIGAMNAGADLYAIDTISGYTTHVPTGANTNISPTSDVRDLASAQTASVVQGVVYDDADADGVIAATEAGAGNQTVALYQQNADGTLLLRGVRKTDGSGNYSFLTGGPGTYVVRLTQPHLNGVNAVQTYASAGSVTDAMSGDAIAVTATCFDDGAVTARTEPGPCAGSVAADAYVDPTLGAIGSTTSVADAEAFPAKSTVVVTGTSAILNADFGITALGSFGDAKTPPFNTTVSQGGPYLVSADSENLYLGTAPGRYADGSPDGNAAAHATDDGVALLAATGAALPLQGNAVASGKSYTVSATVGGELAGASRVRGWQALASAASVPATPAFSEAAVDGTAEGALQAPIITSGLPQVQGRFVAVPSSVDVSSSDNTGGAYGPAPGSAAAVTTPWAVPGEVEDYAYFAAPALVRVSANLLSGAVPVTLGFSLTNVAQTAPSTNADSITLTAASTPTISSAIHSVSTTGAAVVLTGSAPEGYTLMSATCTDSVTGAPQTTVRNGDTVSVTPNLGDDILCEFDYRELEPTLQIVGTKTVAPLSEELVGILPPDASNWDITVSSGASTQVISGADVVRLEREVTYTIGERLRTDAAPQPGSRLYSQKGQISCTDAEGAELPDGVFDADAGTITIGALDLIVTPLQCTLTNQTAHVGLVVKRVGGETTLPTAGWSLAGVHDEAVFDFDLDLSSSARAALPAAYSLTAAAPSGWSVIAIEKLDVSSPACLSGLTDLDAVSEECWQRVGGVTSVDDVAQGQANLYRILAAAPEDLPVLPFTGGLGSWLFTLGGGGVLIAAALAYGIRRRTLRAALASGEDMQ